MAAPSTRPAPRASKPSPTVAASALTVSRWPSRSLSQSSPPRPLACFLPVVAYIALQQRHRTAARRRRRRDDALMSYVDAALAPQRTTGHIKLHGPAAFEGMRKAGRLAAECLDMLADEVRPGVPTETIDRLVFDFAMSHHAVPATLMYRGYRKSTCTSVNHVVCHGIPGEKPLKEGDIVNVDVTLILDGWHGDSSRMYGVGAIPRRAERLIEVTYEAMMRGISVIRPGATTGDIGAAIQTYVEAQHMSVVRDFC